MADAAGMAGEYDDVLRILEEKFAKVSSWAAHMASRFP